MTLSKKMNETEILANTIAMRAVRFRIPDLLLNKISILPKSLHAVRTFGFDIPGNVNI